MVAGCPVLEHKAVYASAEGNLFTCSMLLTLCHEQADRPASYPVGGRASE